jgi:hypothetical protein
MDSQIEAQPMSWYGWIATAAVFAGIVTLLIPKRIGDRIPAAVFWIVIVTMFAAAGYREREWFLSAVGNECRVQ